MSDANRLWYDKYRPMNVDEYVFKDESLRVKVNQWIDGKDLPHLFIFGPPGTGKTTLGLLLSNSILVDQSDLLYISYGQRGIDVVQNEILNFCQTGGWNGLRIVFLDEFDNFTLDAQKMLRGLIQSYSDSVRFIVTANYPAKIIDGLHSRLTPIEIKALDHDEFMTRLISILIQEDIEIDDQAGEALEQIVQARYPDMRASIRDMSGQIINGKLVPAQAEHSGSDLTGAVIALLQAGAPIGTIRETLAGIRRDEIDGVYRYLWENSETLFVGYEREAILVIANEEYKHTLRSFPEIGVAATLIQLDELRKINEAG